MDESLRDIAIIVVRRSRKFPGPASCAARYLLGKELHPGKILAALATLDQPARYDDALVRLGIIYWLVAVLSGLSKEEQLSRAYA